MITADKAFSKISALLSRRESFSERDLKEATQGLTKKQIPKLRIKLLELKTQLEKNYAENLENVQAAANHDRAFGRESIAMSDYYDNDVSAFATGTREKTAKIDRVLSFLAKIS